jgi:hypothetical protein
MARLLRFLGVCPTGCYKVNKGGAWVCVRCGS